MKPYASTYSFSGTSGRLAVTRGSKEKLDSTPDPTSSNSPHELSPGCSKRSNSLLLR
jgi:hypothetical protein